ncbi:hypothetical protein [Prosthecomicrobium sp. N25]|uniref:hypothetical protein n=1 Tax=Prosthecomicrobium sp. N25 TaxID=3129254 RepID=UPI00307723E6
MRHGWIWKALLCLMLAAGPAHAAELRIVLLGASNENGKGVSPAEAYPAKLGEMLKAKGIVADISITARNGENSRSLLARADASVPDGTRLVLIGSVRANDHRSGISQAEHDANRRAIAETLAKRGIRSIAMMYRPLPPDGLQPDGIHLTPSGHAAVAARILPEVVAVLRGR